MKYYTTKLKGRECEGQIFFPQHFSCLIGCLLPSCCAWELERYERITCYETFHTLFLFCKAKMEYTHSAPVRDEGRLFCGKIKSSEKLFKFFFTARAYYDNLENN